MVQIGTGDSWEYNYHAFGAADLQNEEHQLEIRGGTPNLFVLDYLTYNAVITLPSSSTTEVPSSTSVAASTLAATAQPVSSGATSSKSKAGPIAGGIVTGIVLLAVIVGATVFFMRRRRQRAKLDDLDLTPPPSPGHFTNHINTIPTPFHDPPQSVITPYSLQTGGSSQMSQPHPSAYPGRPQGPGSATGKSSIGAASQGVGKLASPIGTAYDTNASSTSAPPPAYDGARALPIQPLKSGRF